LSSQKAWLSNHFNEVALLACKRCQRRLTMQGQAVFFGILELNYFKNITQCKKASLIEEAQKTKYI
jgi:hypothetical protein